MGNYCAANPKFKEDFYFVREYETKSFGFIKIVRNDKLNRDVAIKQLTFPTHQQMEKYIALAKRAKQYQNIPTLIKLHGYTIQNRLNQSPYTVIINFDFLNRSLNQYISDKKIRFRQFIKRNKRGMEFLEGNKIKLNQYQKIEKLTFSQRKYINLYFLQAQILRMIDHVVGAIYFLNHFNNQHSAIRPDNILVDQQGKYILVDRNILRLKTNYQIVLKDKISIQYLSPNQFKALQLKLNQPKHIAQLSDIFAVGMIALEMATLEIQNHIYDFNNLKFNQKQILKLIGIVRSRYSLNFTQLIQKMLVIDQNQRINFSNLIDALSPVLTANLSQMQRVYGGNIVQEQVSFRNQQGQKQGILSSQEIKSDELYKKLTNIEYSYQRIMLNKPRKDDNSLINEQQIKTNQQKLLNRLRRLKEDKNRTKKNKIQLQIGGNDLYQLYMKQYQSIRKSREKQIL